MSSGKRWRQKRQETIAAPERIAALLEAAFCYILKFGSGIRSVRFALDLEEISMTDHWWFATFLTVTLGLTAVSVGLGQHVGSAALKKKFAD